MLDFNWRHLAFMKLTPGLIQFQLGKWESQWTGRCFKLLHLQNRNKNEWLCRHCRSVNVVDRVDNADGQRRIWAEHRQGWRIERTWKRIGVSCLHGHLPATNLPMRRGTYHLVWLKGAVLKLNYITKRGGGWSVSWHWLFLNYITIGVGELKW